MFKRRTPEEDLKLLNGDPKKAIAAMFVPFLLTAMVVQVNQFADTFWVSGLGAVAGSAVSTIIPVYGMMMMVGMGLAVGATTAIAFRLGRDEREEAGNLAGQTMLLAIFFSVISSVLVFLLLDAAIDLMGAGDVRKECHDYMMPFVLLSPLVICESAFAGILRGQGAAAKSTVMQVTAALFNIALDPVFIYTLGLGLSGAAFATCISALLALIIGFSFSLGGKLPVALRLSALRPHREGIKEVLGVGGPRALQGLISSFTDLLQRVFLIIAGGTNAAMFYNYAWRYLGLVQLPTGALDTSMVPVCSAANGRNDAESMRAGIRYTLKLVIVCSLVSTVLLYLLADPLISIMTQEATMRPLHSTFVWTLQVSAVLLPFAALMGIGNSVLQALKKAKYSMYYMLLWSVIKLAAYAVVCVYSFEAIIYVMVLMHVFGGICLIWMANKEFAERFPGLHLF